MSHANEHSTPKADDALFIRDNTPVSEVKEFIRRRTENPVKMNGITVWNYSSYEINEAALREATASKLQADQYYVPYQVTGTWGFMFSLLPEEIQQSEILVYQPKKGKYYAYNNFMADISREQRESFTHDLARRVADLDV